MSKPKPSPKPAKPRNFLLLRFGGRGDALFLTPVAAELQRRGWRVHAGINEPCLPMLEHLSCIDRLMPLLRESVMPTAPQIPNHPCDLIQSAGAWIPVEAIYPQYPGPGAEYGEWAVANYRFVIESNSLHPWINRGQNSNFINTYDLHFSWAGIDPTSVPAEHRRPRYVVTSQERAAIKASLAGLPRPLYLIQPFASSPARSYHRVAELYQSMKKLTRGSVIVWNGNNWETNGLAYPLPNVEGSAPIRMSAALVEQADLLISADTALSHVAEALNVRHLTFYSTVPAWTRSRDYTHEITVDLTVPDSRGRDVCKCGIIARDCPRIAAEAYARLSDRQRDLLKLMPPQNQAAMGLVPENLDTGGRVPPEYFETTPAGLQAEHNAAVQTYDGLRQRPAHCIASLDLWPHVEKAIREMEGK